MRTARQTDIRRALLLALEACGSWLLPDALLRGNASRQLVPAPTTAELDAEIRAADTEHLMTGVQSETGAKWKLADAGRAWLAENL